MTNLEAKYPQLCELCSSKTSPCEYTDNNRHAGALRCLTIQGQVAYVSLQDAQEFFSVVRQILLNFNRVKKNTIHHRANSNLFHTEIYLEFGKFTFT